MADPIFIRKPKVSIMAKILQFYQQRLPKRMRLLLLVAAIFLAWQLVMYWSRLDPVPGRRDTGLTEPNQTLWKEILALRPEK